MSSAQALFPADLVATVPRLRRYARVLLGGAEGADDLVAAVLAQARRERRRTAENPATWLFRRTRAALPGEQQPAVASAGKSSDLCTRLLALPRDEREVLLLVAVERFSYSDVAAVLDVPVATVLSTLTRARERFATAGHGS